jgi:hypothetical protein
MLLLVTMGARVALRDSPQMGKMEFSSLSSSDAGLSSGHQVRRVTVASATLPSVPDEAEADKKACRWEGHMGLNDGHHKDMVLDLTAVRSFGPAAQERLRRIQHLTVDKYEKYLTSPPGREHYALLYYLVDLYGAESSANHTAAGGATWSNDCRHVVDIGTRFAASSLALGSSLRHPTRVWTFDLPRSRERVMAFRGATEDEWQSQAQGLGVAVTFHNLNLLDVSDDEFRKYMATWLILLDTAHLPKTVPFEREFFQRLQAIGYRGLLLLDDIHLNDEMREWWKELKAGADLPTENEARYRVYDVTAVGHSSGTGLVDFSSRVSVYV